MSENNLYSKCAGSLFVAKWFSQDNVWPRIVMCQVENIQIYALLQFGSFTSLHTHTHTGAFSSKWSSAYIQLFFSSKSFVCILEAHIHSFIKHMQAQLIKKKKKEKMKMLNLHCLCQFLLACHPCILLAHSHFPQPVTMPVEQSHGVKPLAQRVSHHPACTCAHVFSHAWNTYKSDPLIKM